ncbi:MAG: type II secretion system F family protein [Rubripirellula sp.]|nr:type II secretion system F family protein [Rubripirellula sp.]
MTVIGVVIVFTFITSVAMVFAGNLVVSDVMERNRKKRLAKMENELIQRNKQKARLKATSKQERTKGSLAHEAVLESKADQPTLMERIKQMIEQSGTELSPPTIFGISVLCAIVASGVTALLLQDFLLGIPAGIVAAPLPLMWVKLKRKQRLELLSSQMPDALELMSRVLRAGQTITQAMLAVAQEFKAPIGSEFLYCYEQQNLGISTDLALRDLAKRTGLLEMKIFVLALIIHRQSGGNLTELLDKLASIIRERYKMRGKIKALTAEGRLQAAILLGLPPAMYGLLLIISRPYALELLNYPKLIFGCLTSMTIGALVIRKIVNFDF